MPQPQSNSNSLARRAVQPAIPPPSATQSPVAGMSRTSSFPSQAPPKGVPDASKFRRLKCQTELQPGGSVENNGRAYRLESRLGSGCFAEVFKAQCPSMKTAVAVKILPEDGEVAARFHQKEAQRLLHLKHPNVVAAFDTFRFRGQLRTYTCIVMEFCGGGTLAERIANREEVFTPATINQYLYQIADGLDYLHANGIVHGDFKSDNILLTRRNQPKITDFGHSRRATGSENSVRSMQGGDLMFAPPEYGGTAAPSSSYDMWSLGCIICELATMSQIKARSPNVPFANNVAAFQQLMQDVQASHGGIYFPLVRGLCVKDPKYRTSATLIKQKTIEMGGLVEPLENDDGDGGSHHSHHSLRRLLSKLTGSVSD